MNRDDGAEWPEAPGAGPLGDDRWATLLYPIYHLEQALKRYLDANTRGWDAAL